MPVVRTGQLDDASAVLELWSLARSEHATTADRVGDVERLISETPSALFVAEADGGEIVGALLAGWDGWRGNMYRLAVHPSHRRRGSRSSCSTSAKSICAVSGRGGSRPWSRTTTTSRRRSGIRPDTR
jgi:ribosomal protein S18 acetylase RimI-like enzyme